MADEQKTSTDGREAVGAWPSNVKAEYITPEERASRLAQSPPGGVLQVGGQQRTGAITSRIINAPRSKEDEQAQDTTNELVGLGAIIAARKFGLEFVWSTKTKQKITLESAEQLCKKNPGLIYFDFDALAELAQPEVGAVEEEEITEETPVETPVVENGDEIVEVPYIPPTAQQTQDELTRSLAAELAGLTDEVEDISEQTTGHILSDVEKRAWGGTLSTPGVQVYIHPNGIVRVDVQGRVRVQKGIQGNTRILRIQRLETPPGGQVRNVTNRTVSASATRSPNPQTFNRNIQADKIPIPVPTPSKLEDETDF